MRTLPLPNEGVPCAEAPDKWFPAVGGNNTGASAKKACLACPILEPCREYGIRHEAHGIWGGLSPDERKVARHRRGITLQVPEVRIAAVHPYRQAS